MKSFELLEHEIEILKKKVEELENERQGMKNWMRAIQQEISMLRALLIEELKELKRVRNQNLKRG